MASHLVQRLNAKRQRVLSVVSLLAILALYTVALHGAYTWRGNTHPDFFIEWLGSRVALMGGNPYSDETTALIQTGSKGHQILPGQDQLAFVYPFYRVFLNAPLAFLPYDWATAIWQTVMHAALVAGLLLFLHSLGWQPSLGDIGAVLLTSLLAYPTFGGAILGQMALGVLALLLVAFWAIKNDRDVLAGGCLALATVKPQLTVLTAPYLLLWSLSCRRWRVMLAFGLVLALLVGASFAFFPRWLMEFVRVATRYPGYKDVQTGPGYLLKGCCGSGWAWLLEVAAIVWLLAAWWAALGRKPGDEAGPRQAHRLEGAFALTMAMTCFLTPQTSPVDRMCLLPGVLLLMRDVPGLLWRMAIAVVSVTGSWLAYACLYRMYYGLHMALPPLIVLLALGAWYGWQAREGER